MAKSNTNTDISSVVVKHEENKKVVEVTGFASVTKEHSEQYLRNYSTHYIGITHERMVKSYNDWTDTYDNDLAPGVYNGPEIIAKVMAEFYVRKEDREKLKILDVAAGTGRVGLELSKLGFKDFDALDPSNGMLKILAGRGLYKEIFEVPIGYGDTNSLIADDTYDCLVIAGGFGEGHIPTKALSEMIRIVKCGGQIFIVSRAEYLDYVAEYKYLEKKMDFLVEQGIWEKMHRTVVPDYSFKKDGIVFVFKVLKNGGLTSEENRFVFGVKVQNQD